MILLIAVIVGLAAGFIRAVLARRPYQPQSLQFIWLVFVALFAQWLVFGFKSSSTAIPDEFASIILVLSQFLLLIFAWKNRKVPGFWLLGVGLVLNLAVIIFNRGWMPISPETVRWLAPDAPPGTWQIGERLALGKDKVLLFKDTRLWILSDHLRTPGWFMFRTAYSIGDVLIAMGAIWLLWCVGGPINHPQEKEEHDDSQAL